MKNKTEIKLEPLSYLVELQQYTGQTFDDLEIRHIRQRDGKWLWSIKRAALVEGPVLNRDLEWEYNSLPSNRDKEELDRTRYQSCEEALEYVKKYLEILKQTGS